MSQKELIFEVEACAHCGKPFHIRIEVVAKQTGGWEDVKTECPYCGKPLMVKLPAKVIPNEPVIRGAKSTSI